MLSAAVIWNESWAGPMNQFDLESSLTWMNIFTNEKKNEKERKKMNSREWERENEE